MSKYEIRIELIEAINERELVSLKLSKCSEGNLYDELFNQYRELDKKITELIDKL